MHPSEVKLEMSGGTLRLLADLAAFDRVEKHFGKPFQDAIPDVLACATIEDTAVAVSLFVVPPDDFPVTPASVKSAMKTLEDLAKARASLLPALYEALPESARKRMKEGAPDEAAQAIEGGDGGPKPDPQ